MSTQPRQVWTLPTSIPTAAAVGAVRGVLDLHSRIGRMGCCQECGKVWPCTTLQAIADALEPEPHPLTERDDLL